MDGAPDIGDVPGAASPRSTLCTVFVIEPLTLVRRVVRRTLERQPGMTVVHDAGSLAEALPLVGQLRPSVTLLAAGVPGQRPAEAVRQLHQRYSGTGIVLLAGLPDGIDLLRAVEAGVRGCLTYAANVEDLVDAIREVHLGGTVLDRVGLSALFQQMSRTSQGPDDPARVLKRLTAKERTVLAMLVQGASKDDIARELTISPETVRTHAQRCLSKLGVHSRLEAVAFVNRHDLLPDLLEQ